MIQLRHHIHRNRSLAALLLALALLVRLLVPTGFMPVAMDGKVLIQICTGTGMQTVAVEMPGREGQHDPADHASAEMPCAFAGLAMPGLAATDSILLAVAIAFLLLMSIRAAVAPMPCRGRRLRPPAQGPPVLH